MRHLLVFCVLLLGVCADHDVQEVQQYAQSVKGGQGTWDYNPAANYYNAFGNNTKNFQPTMRTNMTASRDLEVGVCYIEVPTASLVHNPSSHVPAGNGSRPDLSRIRSCCRGYIRNIHNFRKCDPVCSQDCVNALCTAPETCTCFPDHVKNLAGFCIPTCPIGCQNGHCSGGECLCKEGFKLDRDSKYCVPKCRENCGGIGNCTAPNSCECKTGYHSTPEGSCKPTCDHCSNGDCVAPNDCRCHQGFAKNEKGQCAPRCEFGFETTPQGCKPVCDRCTHGDCAAPNDCRCHQGYGKDYQGQCVAQCSPACGPNSRCISPNVCDPPTQPNQPYQPYQPYQPNQPNQPNQPYQPYQPNQPYQPYQPNQPNQPYQPNRNQDNSVYVPYNNSQPLYPENQNVVPLPNSASQCAQACLNGVCVDGRCNCNPGYIQDRNDNTGSICVPHCPGGCPNGTCSSPHFCICNMGYVKDHSVKGRQSCIKRAKRSAPEEQKTPLNVAELLIFEIPVNQE